jgi:intraflagellar transport protein 88
VLERLGQIANKADDESQAYHYYLESYRHYPVDLDVISWLGVWYVKSELYERAVAFFERAAQIQPREVKWRLMVASCHRRVGAYGKAVDAYERIHADAPDNLECLRYLVAMYKDLGRPYEAYQQKLARLDRSSGGGGGRPPATQISMQQQQLQQQQQQQQQDEDTGARRGSFGSGGSSGGGGGGPHLQQRAEPGSSGGAGQRDEVDFDDADVDDLLA